MAPEARAVLATFPSGGWERGYKVFSETVSPRFYEDPAQQSREVPGAFLADRSP